MAVNLPKGMRYRRDMEFQGNFDGRLDSLVIFLAVKMARVR